MAENIDFEDSASEELILRMIAQDLGVEDQLSYVELGEDVLGELIEDSGFIEPLGDYPTGIPSNATTFVAASVTGNSHEGTQTDQQLSPQRPPSSRSSSENKDNTNNKQIEAGDSTLSSCSSATEPEHAYSSSTVLPIPESFNIADEHQHTDRRSPEPWTFDEGERIDVSMKGEPEHRSRPIDDSRPFPGQLSSNVPPRNSMSDRSPFDPFHGHTSPYLHIAHQSLSRPVSREPPSNRLFIASRPDSHISISPRTHERSKAKPMRHMHNLDSPSYSSVETDTFAPANLEGKYAGDVGGFRYPTVRYQGTEHIAITIPWAGKPGWVERAIDESFDRDELESTTGSQRASGQRHVRFAERMEQARRRKEEATAVELRIGENETLDSIMTGIINEERREMKGKGKAFA